MARVPAGAGRTGAVRGPRRVGRCGRRGRREQLEQPGDGVVEPREGGRERPVDRRDEERGGERERKVQGERASRPWVGRRTGQEERSMREGLRHDEDDRGLEHGERPLRSSGRGAPCRGRAQRSPSVPADASAPVHASPAAAMAAPAAAAPAQCGSESSDQPPCAAAADPAARPASVRYRAPRAEGMLGVSQGGVQSRRGRRHPREDGRPRRRLRRNVQPGQRVHIGATVPTRYSQHALCTRSAVSDARAGLAAGSAAAAHGGWSELSDPHSAPPPQGPPSRPPGCSHGRARWRPRHTG